MLPVMTSSKTGKTVGTAGSATVRREGLAVGAKAQAVKIVVNRRYLRVGNSAPIGGVTCLAPLPFDTSSRSLHAQHSRLVAAVGDDIPLMGLLAANVRAARSADIQPGKGVNGRAITATVSVSQ